MKYPPAYPFLGNLEYVDFRHSSAGWSPEITTFWSPAFSGMTVLFKVVYLNKVKSGETAGRSSSGLNEFWIHNPLVI